MFLVLLLCTIYNRYCWYKSWCGVDLFNKLVNLTSCYVPIVTQSIINTHHYTYPCPLLDESIVTQSIINTHHYTYPLSIIGWIHCNSILYKYTPLHISRSIIGWIHCYSILYKYTPLHIPLVHYWMNPL